MTGTVPGIDTVVDDYLRRVRAALTDLPTAQSQEIVQELGEHIREAREDGAVATEADARDVLDRLGEPSAIAAEAHRRFGQRDRSAVGSREIGALLLLTVGSFLLPVIGWVAGILLLWTSQCWNRRDKIIGTVLTPGGMLLVFLGAALITATGGSGGLSHFALLMVFVMPIATAIYLLVRLNQRLPVP
jgi:uncharacterized membrane protein